MSARKPVNETRQSNRPPRKARLGQNFLADPNAARRIVEALGDIGSSVVIEIGAGRGALTELLALRAEYLIATELDKMLAQRLRVVFAERNNVEIIDGDFLKLSLASLISTREKFSPRTRVKVAGNIPYYITSDILLHLLAQHEAIETAVLMVQREVADHLVAAPGSRDYGLLTVTTQLFADVERLFTLPPSAFAPPPQVHSTVLRLIMNPKAEKLAIDATQFLNFCKLAFAEKRKTLFNNLRKRYEDGHVRQAIHSIQVRADARAETLALEQLANVYLDLLKAKTRC